MKYNITVIRRDGSQEIHEGNMQLLSIGVLEITKETSDDTSTFLASVKKKIVLGIPLSDVKTYVVEQIN